MVSVIFAEILILGRPADNLKMVITSSGAVSSVIRLKSAPSEVTINPNLFAGLFLTSDGQQQSQQSPC